MYIKPVEKRFKAKVYHVIEGESYYGHWLALLFVSEDKGVWIYAYNITYPELSEGGTTVLRAVKGGLYRVF